MQEIYLQDCGSTHGTYINKKRLEAGVEIAVAQGEIITFGQRVTSGAGGSTSLPTIASKRSLSLLNTYSHIPRQRILCSFEVGISQVGPLIHLYLAILWLTCYSEVQQSYSTNTMRAQQTMHTVSISAPTFTNDFEHSSEPSREGSVQIVDSHHLNTFSVPSSDDEIDSEDEEEEIQIASSVQGDEEEVSAATTPDRQAVGKPYTHPEGEAQGSKAGPARGETRILNLTGPNLRDLIKTAEDGTSQQNPINLEGVSTNIIDVDTESEDDGPDILPFYESSKADQPNRSRVWDEPQVARQTSAVKMPTMMTVAEIQSDLGSEIQRHHIVPETQAEVAQEDEARGHEPDDVLAGSTAGANDDFDSEDDDGFDCDSEFFAGEDSEPFRDPPVVNVGVTNKSNPKVTFHIGSGKPRYTTLTPPFDEIRPARPGHISVSDAIDLSQSAEPTSTWAQRAPSPSDAALARKASDPKTSLGRDIFDNYPAPQWPATANTTYPVPTDHAPEIITSREEYSGAYSWPELQSPEPRLYDQGPFSSQPKVVVPAPPSPKPENMRNRSKKASVSWADPHEEIMDDLKPIERLFEPTGKQASKITIPSLVENYVAESRGSFKRKPEGVSASNEVDVAPKSSSPVTRTSGYKRTFAEAISSDEDSLGTKLTLDPADSMWRSEDNITQRQLEVADRDSPLPDAQPRENMIQTPAASMSQEDSVAEPALSSVSATTTVPDNNAGGPARKKAKTSASSSGGIAKFVMGVGFGLLGAAAAFVATIPASVYEEALSEVGNAS